MPELIIMEDIKNIIESLLFVAEEPLTVDRIKKVLDSTDSKTIRNVLSELSKEYETRKGAFFLREVAEGYQIRTRPEYSQWIRRLLRPNPLRLSGASLETLAIVAYKQPVIRSDIEHIRGVDCGGIMRMLLERKLVRVIGRKEMPGRPMVYATTKKFLEIFELKDLKDLPSLKEIEELGNSSSETLAQAASDIIEQTTEDS
jgi:segregation and condensation protein B